MISVRPLPLSQSAGLVRALSSSYWIFMLFCTAVGVSQRSSPRLVSVVVTPDGSMLRIV